MDIYKQFSSENKQYSTDYKMECIILNMKGCLKLNQQWVLAFTSSRCVELLRSPGSAGTRLTEITEDTLTFTYMCMCRVLFFVDLIVAKIRLGVFFVKNYLYMQSRLLDANYFGINNHYRTKSKAIKCKFGIEMKVIISKE